MITKNIIKVTGTVLVNKNLERVFGFFANPVNDNLWRTEINESKLNENLQLGTTVFEYSYLSKKAPNNLIQLTCVQYDKNNVAVFETSDNAPFYLKSHRQVKPISGNRTEVIYTLDFDLDIVKFALGFSLPKFVVSFKAKSDMKKYLRQLKTRLENN